ncbi:helix-turn-helix domain-containing protein [Cohnella hongkongensis]|uniref:Helix-turn-helix domain-containing protein n=1 Tax=Cohnella hongkongensis TaxID=178337 RepID=A0ABV9FA20_9BACL
MKSKTYLLRLVTAITVLMTALMAVSSLTLYWTIEKTTLKLQFDANRQVLGQVDSNLDAMNEMVKNFTLSLFFDSDIVYLMNVKSVEIYENYTKLDRLRKFASTVSYLHSASLYNAYMDKLQTTAPSNDDDPVAQAVARLLRSGKNLPNLQFIPVSLSGRSPSEGGTVDFFAYILTDASGSSLVLNIKADWIFQGVNNIDRSDVPQPPSIYLMNSSTILNPDAGSVISMAELSRSVRAEPDSEGAGYLLYDSTEGKQLVTYMKTKATDWTAVSVRSYKDMLGKINGMRAIAYTMIAAFVVTTVVLSLALAYALYRPIDKLVGQIARLSGAGDGQLPPPEAATGELFFVSSQYRNMMDKMKEMSNRRDAEARNRKGLYLRRLIADSALFAESDWELLRGLSGLGGAGKPGASDSEASLSDAGNERLTLCVLKPDRFHEWRHRPEEETRLLKFAIANVVGETLAKELACEVIPMHSDHLVLLGSAAASDDGGSTERICGLLRSARDYIERHYHISFTSAVVGDIPNYKRLTEAYDEALRLSMYRLVLGRGAVIVPEAAANRGSASFQFPAREARLLDEGMKTGNLLQIEAQLQSLFEAMRALDYDQILYTLLHLFSLIGKAVQEIGAHSAHPVAIDLKQVYQTVMEEETLDDMRLKLMEAFQDLVRAREDGRQSSRDYALVKTIKAYIQEHCRDANLSLQQIAADLKLPPSHVSRIFRSFESVSITSYITETRLNQAKRLLEMDVITVNEVLQAVGFWNQSYFFKLFKKKFGATPQEYRNRRKNGQVQK